jgi:DnaJ-class molecular chaperone
MSLLDLEDTMDFGDMARRAQRERERLAAGEMACPTCDKTGSVIAAKRERKCSDCDGIGWMTRAQQNEYYGEGGVLDAEEDQAYLEREFERLEEEAGR